MLFVSAILCLSLFTVSSNAQSCLTMVGVCVAGGCPDSSQSCISGVCCTTDAAPAPTPATTVAAISQTCATIVGACVLGACPGAGQACMSDVCCITAPATTTSAPTVATTIQTTAPPATVSTCVDKVGSNGVSDCQKNAYLCNNSVYYDLMTQQCPKTCGRCGAAAASPSSNATPTPASSTCVDKLNANGRSDCAVDAYLCNNPAYYDLMTQQCPKTCGRC